MFDFSPEAQERRKQDRRRQVERIRAFDLLGTEERLALKLAEAHVKSTINQRRQDLAERSGNR